MVNWLYHITSSLIALSLLGSCATDDPYDELVRGTIAYPFLNTNPPLGKERRCSHEPFIIRTISGPTEYVVEIPGAAADYDVEVPIANISNRYEQKVKVRNAQVTDRELVSVMPKLSKATQKERALMDKAFGVGEKGGPRQAPSFTMGISKIKKLYKKGNYEYALVEINNLIAFYPTSTKLYKMKGTVLIKMRNFELALRAWTRAGELSPRDPVIKKGVIRLKRRIDNNVSAASDGQSQLAQSSQVEGEPASEEGNGEGEGNQSAVPAEPETL